MIELFVEMCKVLQENQRQRLSKYTLDVHSGFDSTELTEAVPIGPEWLWLLSVLRRLFCCCKFIVAPMVAGFCVLS